MSTSPGLHDAPTGDPGEQQGPGALPQRIGSYRITGLLGSGGMGLVYSAEQDDPRRTVALKVLRPGLLSPAALRRFEQEKRVLARLRHPGIVPILDAGTDSGPDGLVPHFAMELVDGEPITTHAARRALDDRARVRLLLEACEAVEHAHRNGVIHRDIKPANVLVDRDGRVRVLDFGVARALDPDLQASRTLTVLGQVVGTLPYMSPEQLASGQGSEDTRTDVYALGVLAFELLAGRLPHALDGLGVVEAARVVTQQPAPRLPSPDGRRRGDLETVVAKALEKDPDRRYSGAGALADDLRRWLAHEPVTARPPSAMYQVRLFARRNRLAFGAGLAVIAALVLGVVAAGWGLLRERDARRRAEAEAAKAVAVTRFLEGMLRQATPEESQGRDVTVAEVLDRAARTLGAELGDQPEVEAALHHALGSAALSLGRWDQARGELERAAELRRSLAPSGSLDLAWSLLELGDVATRQGRLDEAERLVAEARAMMERFASPPHAGLARGLRAQAAVRLAAGEEEEGIRLLEEATAMLRELPGEEPALCDALVTLARARHVFIRDQQLAREPYEEALQRQSRLYGADSYQVAMTTAGYARLLQDLGRAPEGLEQGLRALAIQRRILPPGHPQIAAALRTVGMQARHAGRLPLAEELLREAVERERELHPEGHLDLAEALELLSHVTGAMGRQRETVALIEEAVVLRRRFLGDDHLNIARILDHLAYQRRGLVPPEQNEALIREAMDITRRRESEDTGFMIKLWGSLVTCYMDQGRMEEALPIAERRVGELDDRAMNNQELPWALGALARVRWGMGDRQDALAISTQAIEHMRSWGGEGHEYLVAPLAQRMTWLVETGRLAAAVHDAIEILTIEKQQGRLDSAEAGAAWLTLARLELERGRADAAAPLATRAAALLARSPRADAVLAREAEDLSCRLAGVPVARAR